MGLDIYLYKCPDRAKAAKAEAKLEQFTEKLWESVGPYESLTDAQKENIRAKTKQKAVELECTGEYDAYHTVEKIELDSTKYPEHMFKVGYFRSSYNGGGIERVLGNLDIPGLHDIFGYSKEYEFVPDWQRAKMVVAESIEKYRKSLDVHGALRVHCVSMNPFSSPREFPQSEEDAMRVLKEELQARGAFESYENIRGWFTPKGFEIIAVMPGMSHVLKDQPCVYVAWKDKPDSEPNWYLQALEIVEETIDYVLTSPNPEQFYVHWSG